MLTLRKLENRIVLDGAVAAAVLGHDSDHDAENVEAQQTDSDHAVQNHYDAFPEVAALISDDGGTGQGVDVVLISDHAPDYQTLVDAVDPEARVVVYDADSDSLADVIESVRTVSEEAGQQIHSLSILSHGENGTFKIGNETVTSDNIDQYSESWATLDSAMSDEGHIYVFGCSVVNDAGEGKSLIDALATATNTYVFGSNDTTGYGGDWELEAASAGAEGLNPAPALNIDRLSTEYEGVLAPAFPGPPAVNLPLTFSVYEDYASGVNFTVVDSANPTSSENLTVWATSSDQTVLPDSSIECAWISGNMWRMDVDPSPNHSSSDGIMINVHAQDSQGVNSDAVGVIVKPVNDRPSFDTVNQTVDGTQGAAMTIPLNQWTNNIDLGPLENPGQLYAQDIDRFELEYVSGDANILSGLPSTDGSHNLILNPNTGYGVNGTVTYRVTIYDTGGIQYDTPGTGDQIGFNSNVATTLLNITVNFNQPPVAQNHDASACEGDNVEGRLSAYDPEGDPFVYVLDSNPQGENGKLTLDQNGGFVYVPYDPDFYGEADTFQFHVREVNTMNSQSSNMATLSIEIEPANDAPSFDVGDDQEVEEDSGSHTIEGWASDIIPGPENESHQTVWFKVSVDNPDLFSELPTVDASTGNLTYTLKPDVAGVAHVTVVLWDNGGTDNCGGIDHSGPETFTITVGDINDPPDFGGGPDQLVCEDSGPQVVPNWAKDIIAGPPSESGQALEFIVDTDRPDLFVEDSLKIDPDGTLRYTPAPDAFGLATVYVRLKDDGGTEDGGVDTSEVYEFTIDIIPVNDAPQYNTEYTGKTVNVTAGSGDQTIENFATDIVPGPRDVPEQFSESDQKTWFEITTDNPDLFAVQPYIDSETGALHYTLADGMDGTANVTVILKDNGGTVVSYIDAYGNEIVCTGDDDSDPVNFEIEAKEPPAPQPVPVEPSHPVYEPEGPMEPPGPQPILRPEEIYVDGELDAGMYYPGDVGPMGQLHMFPVGFRSMRGPAGDAPLVDVCTLEEVLQSHLGCRFAPGIYPETRLSSVRWPDLEQERPILDEEHDMFSKLFMREPGDEGFNTDADNPAGDQTFQVELGDLSDMAPGVLKDPVFAQQPGIEDLNDMSPGELKQAFFANKDKSLDRTMRWCMDQGEPVPWENCRENTAK